MSTEPLQLSFASDVRLVRRIGLGLLVFGLVAPLLLGSTKTCASWNVQR